MKAISVFLSFFIGLTAFANNTKDFAGLITLYIEPGSSGQASECCLSLAPSNFTMALNLDSNGQWFGSYKTNRSDNTYAPGYNFEAEISSYQMTYSSSQKDYFSTIVVKINVSEPSGKNISYTVGTLKVYDNSILSPTQFIGKEVTTKDGTKIVPKIFLGPKGETFGRMFPYSSH